MHNQNHFLTLSDTTYGPTLKDNYFIAPFTLDSASVAPQKTLKQLQGFDLIMKLLHIAFF